MLDEKRKGKVRKLWRGTRGVQTTHYAIYEAGMADGAAQVPAQVALEEAEVNDLSDAEFAVLLRDAIWSDGSYPMVWMQRTSAALGRVRPQIEAAAREKAFADYDQAVRDRGFGEGYVDSFRFLLTASEKPEPKERVTATNQQSNEYRLGLDQVVDQRNRIVAMDIPDPACSDMRDAIVLALDILLEVLGEHISGNSEVIMQTAQGGLMPYNKEYSIPVRWRGVYRQCVEFLAHPGEPSTKPIEWCISILEELAAAEGHVNELETERDEALEGQQSAGKEGRRMIIRLRRWFFATVANLAYRLGKLDICEVCEEEIADGPCVGCGRRICMNCNSGYYEDEELCTLCRKDITPEEEGADRKLEAELNEEESQ